MKSNMHLYEVRLRHPHSRRPRKLFVPAYNQQEALLSLSTDQRHRLLVVRQMSDADRAVASFFDFPSWFGISSEKMAMLSNFSLLLKVGLPILDALYLQVRNTPSLKMKAALMDAAHQIQTNGDIAHSFGNHPYLFSASDLSMIKAGEGTGQLDAVFAQLGESYKKSAGTMKKIRNAMIYPGVILVLTYCLAMIFCYMLVPKLRDVYAQLNAKLPWSTMQLVYLSETLESYPWASGIPPFIAVILFKLKSTHSVQYVLYRLAMVMPIARTYTNKIAMTNVMRSLALTTSAGIPLNEGLEMAITASGHPVYARALKKVLAEINNGVSPSAAFYLHANDFGTEGDRLSTTMEVGERTGDVNKPIAQLATIYEEDLETAASNLQKLVEPLSVLMVAVVIGFLVFAMYYPIFTLGMNFMDNSAEATANSFGAGAK